MGKRERHTAAFKAQAALAAAKGDRALNELAGQFGAHPTPARGPKKHLLAGAEAVFAGGARAGGSSGDHRAGPYQQIGRLKREGERPEKKAAVFG